MSIKEATDTVMATLGAYDALWDGVLTPEIVDAEYYDWDDDPRHPFILTRIVKMPIPLKYHSYPPLMEGLARNEAMDVLKAVVKARVDNIPAVVTMVNKTGFVVSLLSYTLNKDGIHYDHPIVWPDRHERANILLKLSKIGVEHTAQCEARDALLETVAELGLAFGGPLRELNLEGVLTDCPFDSPSDNRVLFGTIK